MAFTAVWVYLTAPFAGMFAAAAAHTAGRGPVHCAKLRHRPDVPCIFCRSAAKTA
jgi:hypothetical protein